jgi:hypothetical protein
MERTSGEIPNFESGHVVLSTGDIQVLRVDLTSSLIDVNIEDKAFIKRVIAMRDSLIPKRPETGNENLPSISGPLSMIRSVAEALCSRGITVVVSYRGHRIVTLGVGAKPTVLQHITKTRGLALNSLYTAIRMII